MYNTNILPTPPPSAELRYRTIPGSKFPCMFTSGGWYRKDAPSRKMRTADLLRACALSIDVDPYDWSGAAEQWGATRKERKAAMRSATESEVLSWMKETDLVATVIREASALGLPTPNRVIYTGQGFCLLYWLPEGMGAASDRWSPEAMKTVLKRWYQSNEWPWFWDKDAKDIGTRIFPVPGQRHRDTGKRIRLLEGQDTVDGEALATFFDQLATRYPPKAKPVRKKSSATVSKSTRTKDSYSVWRREEWRPGYPDLEDGGRGTCPSCGGSGYKRMNADHYACFSCKTRYLIPKSKRLDSGVVRISLDRDGRARWPEDIPDRVVISTRTGSGKTWLMERERKTWSPSGAYHRRVLALCPTKALSRQLARRLDIGHGEAASSIVLRSESVACCLASLPRKLGGARPELLRRTLIQVDEVEACLQQLHGMMKAERAREVYNLLIYAVAHAGRVMLCDAHIGTATRRLLEDVAAYREKHGLEEVSFESWDSAPHIFGVEYIPGQYTTTRSGAETCIASSDKLHKGLIRKRLEEGKRLAIYIPGRYAAQGFADLLVRRYPTKTVRCVVGSRSNDTENDLSPESLLADVLVYNNAMNTGVSIDAEHYDEVHVLINRGQVATGPMVEQAIHRVRRPKNPTIYLSGVESAPVSGWRLEAEGHMVDARRRFHSANRLVRASSKALSLMSDFMCSDDAVRLARLQAVLLASRYQTGLGWTVAYLGARHAFERGDGFRDDSFSEAASEARDARELDEAVSVAKAAPLSERQFERVETGGAETMDEYHAYRAGVMRSVYGQAYTGGDVATRTDVALRTKRSQLAQRTRVFAATLLLAKGADVLLASAEVRAATKQTFMSLRPVMPRARVLQAALDLLFRLEETDGRIAVDQDDGQSILLAVEPHLEAAGLTARRDATPFRMIQTVLALGGLRLDVRRYGPRGQRTREYFLAVARVRDMARLSKKTVDRWESHSEDVEAVA